MTTGVYSIMHIASRRRYIGSTCNTFGERWNTHRKFLRVGKHHSRKLQNAWNKYGEKAFRWRVLKYCSPNECLRVEQEFIQRYDAAGKGGFNVCPTAGNSRGRKLSPSHVEKMRQFMRTFRHTEESKRKISEAHRGRVWSEERRAAASIARSNSPVIRAMLIARNKSERQRNFVRNAIRSPDAIKRVADWHRGRKRSPEARARILEGIRLRRAKPSPAEQERRNKKRLETLARNKALAA